MRNEPDRVTIGGNAWTGLQLIFITLKLIDVGAPAAWSWWWVLAPTWGALLLGAVTLGVLWLFNDRNNNFFE